MSAKVRRMQGLARIRRVQEETERRELAAALGAVHEVGAALRGDGAALIESDQLGRAALGRGDRGEWLLAEAQGEVARANLAKLRLLLTKREAAVPAARARYLACRLEHERTKVLVDASMRTEADEQARREQAAADEWVISRWMIVKSG